MGRGSLGRVLLLQLSSHLVPLLLQESSHLLPLLLQESTLLKLFLLKLFWFTFTLVHGPIDKATDVGCFSVWDVAQIGVA